MLIDDILGRADGAYVYMENFVNDGSPSGFSTVNFPPKGLAPGTLSPVKLIVLHISSNLVVQLGNWLPTDLTATAPRMMEVIAHPLTAAIALKEYSHSDLCEGGEVHAWLTAGGRTFILDPDEHQTHVKLHYPGILGRVRRELPFLKATAGYEVSSEIEEYIANNKLPFGLLREYGSRSVLSARARSLDDSWSCVLRDGTAYPMRDHARPLVPAFSLFGRDRLRPSDASLAFQLWKRSNTDDPVMWLWDKLLEGLLRSYIALTFDLGLMPELNAQNLLFELSDSFRPVFRDMSRVEKMLHRRRLRARSEVFRSSPYKVVDLAADAEYARIRHSFSYDFKLSTYVIDPLLRRICAEAEYDLEEGRSFVRRRAIELLGEDASVYQCFPASSTSYGHPKTLLTGAREYVELGPALFR